jgi:hypothetical protein
MKLKEFAGEEIELTDMVDSYQYPVPVIYVSDLPEQEGAVVEWIEPLQWHVETWQNMAKALRLDRFGDFRYPLWTRVIEDKITEVFEEEGAFEENSIRVDDASAMLGDDSEHGGVHIIMQLPQHALDMDVDDSDLLDMAWNFIATCQNLTDPGTFGCVYLFAEVARKLDIDWTDEVHEAGGVRGVMV